MANFIALGIYFIFGTKFSRNEGIDTCFNVEYVLLGRNYFGGYLVVTVRYLSITGGYWSLPLVTFFLIMIYKYTFNTHNS